jgi:NAD(P)-dependent dehydrogenase (short-subunit alcohol dehydrogenase family)
MTTVLITGASAGVGRAVARRFAQPGARIALVARSKSRLETAADEVRAAGGEALVLPVDVADAAALDAAAERTEHEFGPITIWINVAMVTVLSPVIEMTPEEYRRVTEVTYLGCVHGTLAALKRMKPRDRGTIVQVGSALAYRSVPLQSAYCAAKSAIVGFTDSLRSELIHDGSQIDLTVVHLPAVNTPQFDWARNKLPRKPQPLPPIFEPEIIADAIHHAALHPRREYWLGWPAIKAIMGQKIAPGLADHLLAHEAYDGQMTSEPNDRGRPDNLFDPVPGDYAARGRFSDRASNSSPAIWSTEHREQLLVLGGLLLAGALGVALTRRSLTQGPGR